jgi:hypothetical protein
MLCSEVIFVLSILDDCDEGRGQPATTIAVCSEEYDECDPPPTFSSVHQLIHNMEKYRAGKLLICLSLLCSHETNDCIGLAHPVLGT